MGITYETIGDTWDGGIQRRVTLRGTFDDNYTAGGEPLEADGIPLSSVDTVAIENVVTESGLIVGYNRDDDAVTLYEISGGEMIELTNASAAANGDTIVINAWGRS